MLRRTPFKRKPPQREARPDRSAEFASWVSPMRKVGTYAAAETFSPAPKESEPVRDRDYRRLVASRPCALCGAVGFSQAAHGNRGKGLSLKTCDLTCFPACTVGARDCHGAWDRYEFGREEQAAREPVLAASTRADLINIARFDPAARRVLVRVGLITEAVFA